jgi:hypothetical protein
MGARAYSKQLILVFCWQTRKEERRSRNQKEEKKEAEIEERTKKSRIQRERICVKRTEKTGNANIMGFLQSRPKKVTQESKNFAWFPMQIQSTGDPSKIFFQFFVSIFRSTLLMIEL